MNLLISSAVDGGGGSFLFSLSSRRFSQIFSMIGSSEKSSSFVSPGGLSLRCVELVIIVSVNWKVSFDAVRLQMYS